MKILQVFRIDENPSLHSDSSLELMNPFIIRYKYYVMTMVLFFSLAVYFLIQAFSSNDVSQANMQKDIASEIIRFHVIANSDQEEDQALKLKVKTALTDALRPTLNNVTSVEEARNILTENLSNMEELANQVIKENGFSYTATISLERGYFPLKVYGDLSLPPGEYEAIRVEIGEAIGQNWWCIMFPPLCFVDATYSIVPETSKEQLKHVLTEEEYDAVFSEKKVDVKVKFKILSVIKNLFSDSDS